VDASPSTRRVAAIVAAALVGALAVAGCGGDGDEPSIPQSGERETTTTEATTTTSTPTASDTTEVAEDGQGGTTTTTAAGEG
jgi:hypothetical protein